MRRYIPQEVKSQAVDLYKNTTLTLKEISQRLGVSEYAVKDWVKIARSQGIIPASFKKKRYSDEVKAKAVQLAQEIGYKKAAQEMKVSHYAIRKWCLEAGSKSPFHRGERFSFRKFEPLQIDGCVFAVNPKWYWLTIAAQELPEIISSRIPPEQMSEYTANETTIQNFLKSARLRTGIFLYPLRCSIIFEERLEDFQQLVIEKCVEVFTELKLKNRYKYFRTVMVVPCAQKKSESVTGP